MTNHPLTIQSLSELSALAAPPCLSLYQPTYRRHPENQQDPVRFCHGVEALAISLRQLHGAGQPYALLTPFYELAADEVSHHALLLPSGIDVNPDALSADQLRERA